MSTNLTKTGIAHGLISLVASEDPELQTLFADGLMWCFGFHQEEAQRHFSELLQRDPTNQLGLWGQAYAASPFYNRTWSWYSPTLKSETMRLGFESLKLARAQSSQNHSSEADLSDQLIDALSVLYPTAEVVSDNQFLTNQVTYAERMVEVATGSSLQPDITTLAVEAQLNCTPWQLWDLDTGAVAPDSRVTNALQLIDAALETQAGKNHPGLLHLHIHAVEMSATPERASNSAGHIRKLVNTNRGEATLIPPHLPHMASHIDVLLGNYREAIEINRIAAANDQKIDVHQGEFYQISRLHNLHMWLFAAMMAGRKQDAQDAELAIENLCRSLYSPDSDAYLSVSIEGFFANRLHTAIRFGDWDSILETEKDEDSDHALAFLPYAKSMACYARGVASANTAQANLAKRELDTLQSLADTVPEWYIINNNPAMDILDVAVLMLGGEHHYHQGEIDQGLELLSEAVDACDKLAYCEPWGWMHPPRHALGALLLAQDRADEARQVYETDLGLNGRLARSKTNPNNVWALHGLLECYRVLGKTEEAEKLAGSTGTALELADINIESSCFCRQ